MPTFEAYNLIFLLIGILADQFRARAADGPQVLEHVHHQVVFICGRAVHAHRQRRLEHLCVENAH